MRDVLVTIFAVVLSFILLAASMVAILNFTRGGQLARDPSTLNRDYATVKARYGDPWQLMSQTVRLCDYGVIPAITLIAGGLVGLLARKRRGLLSCLAVLPLVAFMLAGYSFALHGFLLAALYLVLAWTGSRVSQLLRPPQTPTTGAET